MLQPKQKLVEYVDRRENNEIIKMLTFHIILNKNFRMKFPSILENHVIYLFQVDYKTDEVLLYMQRHIYFEEVFEFRANELPKILVSY